MSLRDTKVTVKKLAFVNLIRMGSDPEVSLQILKTGLGLAESLGGGAGNVDDEIGRASCRERVYSSV